MSSAENLAPTSSEVIEIDYDAVIRVHKAAEEIMDPTSGLGHEVITGTETTDILPVLVEGRAELVRLQRVLHEGTWDYTLSAAPQGSPRSGFATTFNDHNNTFWRAPQLPVDSREAQQQHDRDEVETRLLALRDLLARS